MSVHFKFKNMIQYDSMKFDGVYVSTAELKNYIIKTKRLVKGDSDLLIEDEQKRCVYNDDQLIPMNTTLVVSRVPFKSGMSHKRQHRSGDQSASSRGTSDRFHPYSHSSSNSSSSAPVTKMPSYNDQKKSLVTESMTEDERIKQIHMQSTRDYDPVRYARGGRGGRGGAYHGHSSTNGNHNNHSNNNIQYPIHPGYTCHRCGMPGHHIKNCPSHSNHKIKLSSGIPRSFMIPSDPDVKGAMMTPSGHFAVPFIDHEAYQDPKKEKVPFMDDNEDEDDLVIQTVKPEVPQEFQCGICHELLNDAVLVKCCQNKFCDECIRTSLINSETKECPACLKQGISPDELIPSEFIRQSVANYTGARPNAADDENTSESTILDQFEMYLKQSRQ